MAIFEDINTISRFLSHEEVANLSHMNPVDCIVLCVCSVLHSAETVFNVIEENPQITKTLVLCGGIGHSTTHIWEAVAHHPRFKTIAKEIQGLPEAQVLDKIFKTFYAPRFVGHPGPRILIEDRSTTCATNAVEARKLLESHGEDKLECVVIVQDPTMVRRTVACFEKVYSDLQQPPRFLGCPIFVPLVGPGIDGGLTYTAPVVDLNQMWDMDRFLELVMGEIPRLRDDKNGYGPKGKGHITHVIIPMDVEQAYQNLIHKIPHRRYKEL